MSPKQTSGSEVVTERVVITRFLSDGSIRTDTIDGGGEIIVQQGVYEPLGNVKASKASTPDILDKTNKPSNVMVGLELSTGLDLSGTDLSTFNADLICGYRHKLIQLLGASLGVHKSLGSRDSFIPIQIIFRTGFQPRQTLVFMHTSIGYSFNTISKSPMFGDFMATLGVGANLVQKRKFQSNICLSFGFRHFTERHQELANIQKANTVFAQISFGISM